MSRSLVSGPYASAVSIKFTPSSTARLRTLSAFWRSGGQPQMTSPVIPIAPKPIRFTARSSSNFQVVFVAILVVVVELAPKITSDSPATSAAPVASVVPRNARRVIAALSFRSERFLCTRAQRTSTQITVNATGGPVARLPFHPVSCAFLPFVHQDRKCLFKIFAESQNACRVSGHDKNLSALHIGLLEELHDFVRELRRAVINGLRACRSLIQHSRPQS